MAQSTFSEALQVSVQSERRVDAYVHDEHDVFGIPHGGYLAAIAANALLQSSGAPDVFSMTTHYLRKAEVGPMSFDIERIGGSRRFTSLFARARQGDDVVLTVSALVGDRTSVKGPTWTSTAAPELDPEHLTPRAGTPNLPFHTPNIAARGNLRLDTRTLAFAAGKRAETAQLQGILELDEADQLTALIACDLAPPVVWNALGPTGWVPTVELTTHVRARPEPGPLRLRVTTQHVADGFLEEDALVYDQAGTLIVQSRQLARWSQPQKPG